MGWEIALMLGYVGVAFLLMYIMTLVGKVEKETGNEESSWNYQPLKLLFLFFGLFVLLLGINSARLILTADGISSDGLVATLDTTYKVFLWVIRLSVAYFIIFYLYQIVMSMSYKKKQKREDEYED